MGRQLLHDITLRRYCFLRPRLSTLLGKRERRISAGFPPFAPYLRILQLGGFLGITSTGGKLLTSVTVESKNMITDTTNPLFCTPARSDLAYVWDIEVTAYLCGRLMSCVQED